MKRNKEEVARNQRKEPWREKQQKTRRRQTAGWSGLKQMMLQQRTGSRRYSEADLTGWRKSSWRLELARELWFHIPSTRPQGRGYQQ